MIAIARADRPKDVILIYRDNGETAEGREFHVINGAWSGILRHDGSMHMYGAREQHSIKCVIVWDGPIPSHAHDCNEMIQWVQEQINA